MHLLTNLHLPLTNQPLLSLPLLLTSLPLPTSLLLMLSQRARTSLTLTSTELLMTTPRLTSTLLRLLMELVLSLDHTLLLFLMVVPSMLSTPPTTTMDMLPRLPTKELLPILRLSHMPLPLPTMLKPSLCFVNIYYFTIFIENIQPILK